MRSENRQKICLEFAVFMDVFPVSHNWHFLTIHFSPKQEDTYVELYLNFPMGMIESNSTITLGMPVNGRSYSY